MLRQSRLAQFYQDLLGKALVFATATEAEIEVHIVAASNYHHNCWLNTYSAI